MLYLVTGGSGSGKSEYAEQLAVRQQAGGFVERGGKLCYVATMYPYDEECLKRIDRHRFMRKDRGFTTIECYHHPGQLSFGERDVVLLECMSNLLANEMYREEGQITARGIQADRQSEEGIIKPVLQWKRQAGSVIVVTNEVFSDGIEYDAETREYLRLLGGINRFLAKEADVLVEVVCSIPVYHKGKEFFDR